MRLRSDLRRQNLFAEGIIDRRWPQILLGYAIV
jgi:hypothetical protein